jgi:tetratricopeptide (TPR) repeat protein
LNIAEEIGNAYEKSRTHLGLGKLHKSIGKYKEALEHYEKGFSFAAGMSGRNLQNPADHMGADQIGINENFSIHYMKGLPFAHLLGNKFGALAGYWELGDLYNKLKKYQKALELFERYLEIAEEINDLNEQERACERLVDIYKQQRRYYMVKQFQQKLQVIAKEREKANCGMYAMPNFACDFINSLNCVALDFSKFASFSFMDVGSIIIFAYTILFTSSNGVLILSM